VQWRCPQAVRHVALPTRQVSREYPTLPRTDDGLGWNVEVLGEIRAGKQSRVFDGLLNGNRSAIKLTESRLTNFAVLTSRTGAEAVGMLGAAHPSLVAPTRIGGAVVQPIGESPRANVARAPLPVPKRPRGPAPGCAPRRRRGERVDVPRFLDEVPREEVSSKQRKRVAMRTMVAPFLARILLSLPVSVPPLTWARPGAWPPPCLREGLQGHGGGQRATDRVARRNEAFSGKGFAARVATANCCPDRTAPASGSAAAS
jgi:hypothetical protein